MASLVKPQPKKKSWAKKTSGVWGDADQVEEDAAADESEDDEEFMPRASGARRGGVSAAVIDYDAPFERVVIAKDDATMAALQATVMENVLFAHLEADELKDVIDAMFPVNPAKGEDVITQGDQGDNFYIIKAGTCLVLIDGAQVGEIPAGGSFGELALMYGTPRAATIQAKTACELFGIDRDTYCRILMGSTMRKRAAYETFLANVPLLKDLDKFERLTIADALTPTTYGAGDVIIKQGDVGDEFFMIQSGSCSVTQEVAGKSGEVAQLGEGDFFGEIALLTGDKRKATVTATSDVKTVKLDRDRFERVLGPCKAILQRDMANYKSFGGI